jgi:hypothetical protein
MYTGAVAVEGTYALILILEVYITSEPGNTKISRMYEFKLMYARCDMHIFVHVCIKGRLACMGNEHIAAFLGLHFALVD